MHVKIFFKLQKVHEYKLQSYQKKHYKFKGKKIIEIYPTMNSKMSKKQKKEEEKSQIPPILACGAPPFLLLISNFFAPQK